MRIFRHVKRLTSGRRTPVAMFSLAVALAAHAHRAEAVNPLGIAFKDTTNVSLYGEPTGMLIAGRCNRNNPAFEQARRRGAEILVYVNATARPDTRVCALDNQLYLNDSARVPLWPYPSDGQRVSYPNTHMTDMRPGSPWILHVVDYVERLIREGCGATALATGFIAVPRQTDVSAATSFALGERGIRTGFRARIGSATC